MNNLLTSKPNIPAILFFILMAIALSVVYFLYEKERRAQKGILFDHLTSSLTEGGLIRSCKRLSGRLSQFALVYIRVPAVNSFSRSYINGERKDILGHVCSSIKGQLRSDELIARMGPDSFCFLIQNRKESEILAKLSAIGKECSSFSKISDYAYPAEAFFGVYFPADGENVADAIEKASYAAFEADSDESVVFYDSIKDGIRTDTESATAIKKALFTGEFTVYYQPRIQVSDQKIVGAEALIRWRHPRRGVLTPVMFLETAARYNLIDKIDRFLFKEVCETAKKLADGGYEKCPVSVNISASSLKNEGVADEYYNICRSYGISPALFELDINEDDAINDPETIASLVDRFHSHGFRCAVDNFGLNQGSLQLLSSIPFDTVKLAPCFFEDNNNRNIKHLVESVFKLCATLHIHTVAVGVENIRQADFLRNAACEMIEGFVYSKPLPFNNFEKYAFENLSLRYTSPSQSGSSTGTISAIAQKETDNNNRITLFQYSTKENSVMFSDPFSPALNGQTYFTNARELFRITNLIHENDRKDFLAFVDQIERSDDWISGAFRFFMPHGKYEWLELRARYDEKSAFISGMIADLSSLKSEVKLWKEKATRDTLTGVYNRAYFEQNAKNILDQKKATAASFIFVDVDDFKGINDSYGHMHGDEVLCFVAKQLLGIFRHTDIIARYGGDEFVVFAPSLDRKILVDRLERLMKNLSHPYRSGTIEHTVSLSIGAAVAPEDGTDYETLLAHADTAVYEAKETGKKQYVLYDPSMKGTASHKVTEINSDY